MRGRAMGPGTLAKRGKLWTLSYSDENGRRRRKSLSTNRQTAERIRTEVIHRRDMARAGLGSEAGQELSLSELLPDYLEDLQARVTPQHFKNMRQRLTHVVEQLEGVRIGNLRAMDVIRVRSRAVADGASHRTANLLVGRLQTMLRWAVRNELIAKSPIEHLDRLPETEEHKAYRRRALSEDEIERFLAASEVDDEENELRASLEGITRVPQTPMWIALLETGARYSELRQVAWADVDLARGTMLLRAENTKSRKRRVIPLRALLVDRLRALRVLHESVHGRISTVQDLVFLTPEGAPYRRPSTNINRTLRRVLEAAGIDRVDAVGDKIDLHALRHTFTSRLARSGVSLFQAQKLVGHSDPKLTAQVYAHVDAEDLRPAIEALPEVAPKPEASRQAQ